MAKGLIPSYGLFWRTDELMWSNAGGTGRRRTLRLLGSTGKGSTKQVADFQKQSGLYILYNRYGAYYVGVVWADRLGNRLRDHLEDGHRGKWDRFSWFGFRRVLRKPDRGGLAPLGPSVRHAPSMPGVSSDAAIGDIEALLIHAFGLRSNKKQSAFRVKQEWQQMSKDDADQFMHNWKTRLQRARIRAEGSSQRRSR
jgi:hypothetical protein